MWRRVAALVSLKDVEPWFLALTRYGPLIDTTVSDRDEQTERRLWETAIGHLAEVAALWMETSEGSNLWQLPPAHHRRRRTVRRLGAGTRSRAADAGRVPVAGRCGKRARASSLQMLLALRQLVFDPADGCQVLLGGMPQLPEC